MVELARLTQCLVSGRPQWPRARPSVPSMCCDTCLRATIGWILRCCRALHVLAFEAPDELGDGGGDGAFEQLGGSGAPACSGEWWPWCLPESVLCAADFEAAAAACAAVVRYCEEAAVAIGVRVEDLHRHHQMALQQPDEAAAIEEEMNKVVSVCWHVYKSAKEAEELQEHFGGVVARQRWDRAAAVAVADDWGHRVTEVFMGDWNNNGIGAE